MLINERKNKAPLQFNLFTLMNAITVVVVVVFVVATDAAVLLQLVM